MLDLSSINTSGRAYLYDKARWVAGDRFKTDGLIDKVVFERGAIALEGFVFRICRDGDKIYIGYIFDSTLKLRIWTSL